VVNDLLQLIMRHVAHGNYLEEGLDGPQDLIDVGSHLVDRLLTQAQLALLADWAAVLGLDAFCLLFLGLLLGE